MVTKTVVFGNIPLARNVIKYLSDRTDAKLVGVVTTNEPVSGWRNTELKTPVLDTANSLGIPIYDLERIPQLDPDLGFTVRYNKIIPEEVLNVFDQGVVNFHGGYLPEYRGVDTATHVILDDADYFGVTLHYLDVDIDTGPVIDRKKETISTDDTSYSLYKKGERMLWELFVANIEDILENDVQTEPQQELLTDSTTKYYKKADLAGEREVGLDEDPSEIVRRIRAFDFPGHEPAFTRINGKKVNLRLESNDEIS
ncbi:Folate-dependent phosphoribosylglycinamide formyltransferase PurN [Halanaeroarchaeum sp. HSR-CO]|nr:Folate-dependent phosphoribosylglycinamide formyltransferase PurN [Halanaeroarchaeum sp. HSR-CO]